MVIESKIIYKMVEFWYNINEQRNGGVAFLSTKPKQKARFGGFFVWRGIENGKGFDGGGASESERFAQRRK